MSEVLAISVWPTSAVPEIFGLPVAGALVASVRFSATSSSADQLSPELFQRRLFACFVPAAWNGKVREPTCRTRD